MARGPQRKRRSAVRSTVNHAQVVLLWDYVMISTMLGQCAYR